jgi:hypothetical protein
VAQPLLEHLHLMTYRCLRHRQLFRGTAEIAVARGSFEHADGGKRRQAGHV